jgi:hypothetical protein
MRLPAQAVRQLPDQSKTLRVDSSSTDDSRLRGALPIPDPCTAANSILFDHLVGEGPQLQRDIDVERLGGLQVDDELELGRQLDWQFGRLGALSTWSM